MFRTLMLAGVLASLASMAQARAGGRECGVFGGAAESTTAIVVAVDEHERARVDRLFWSPPVKSRDRSAGLSVTFSVSEEGLGSPIDLVVSSPDPDPSVVRALMQSDLVILVDNAPVWRGAWSASRVSEPVVLDALRSAKSVKLRYEFKSGAMLGETRFDLSDRKALQAQFAKLRREAEPMLLDPANCRTSEPPALFPKGVISRAVGVSSPAG